MALKACALVCALMACSASLASAVPGEVTANPSGTLTLLIPVRNDQSERQTFQARVDAPRDWILLLPFGEVVLDPSEHRAQAVVIRVPPAARAGRHTLTVTVMPHRGPPHEIAYRVLVPERTELGLDLDAPAVAIDGVFQARVRISNHGNVRETVTMHVEGLRLPPLPTFELEPGEQESFVLEGTLSGEPGRLVARTITLRARSDRGTLATQRHTTEVLTSGSTVERTLPLRLSVQMDTAPSPRLRVQLTGEGSLREAGDDVLSLNLDHAAPRRHSQFLASYRHKGGQVRFGWGTFQADPRLGTWDAWGAEARTESMVPWDGSLHARLVLTQNAGVGGRIDVRHPLIGEWTTAAHALSGQRAFVVDAVSPTLGHPDVGFLTLSGTLLASDTHESQVQARYTHPQRGVSLEMNTRARQRPDEPPSRDAHLHFRARNAVEEAAWNLALDAHVQEQDAFKAATSDPWALGEEPVPRRGDTAGIHLGMTREGAGSHLGLSASVRYEDADSVLPRTITTFSAAHERRGTNAVQWGQRASLRFVESWNAPSSAWRSIHRLAWQATARLDGHSHRASAALTVLSASFKPLLAQLQAGFRFGPRLDGSVTAVIGTGFDAGIPSYLDVSLELPVHQAWRVAAGMEARWDAGTPTVTLDHHASVQYRSGVWSAEGPLQVDHRVGYTVEGAALDVHHRTSLRAEDGRALSFRTRLAWVGDQRGVDVQAGLSWIHPIEVPLPSIGRHGQLLIRLHTTDGEPVEGVILTIGDRAGRTNALGEAIFDGMREGVHVLDVHPSSQDVAALLLPGAPMQVDIRAGERAELALVQARAGSIEGRLVVAADGAWKETETVVRSWRAFTETQLASSVVRVLLTRDDVTRELEVGADGRFSALRLEPGEWRIDVEEGTLPQGSEILGLPVAVRVEEGQATSVRLEVIPGTGVGAVREGGTLSLP